MRVLFHYQVSDALAERLHALQSSGLEIDVVPVSDRAQFLDRLPEAEVLWHVLDPITEDHIHKAPKLRLIQKIGVGVNTIDLDAAKSQGIRVCNMPGTNTQAVAEMTLLLMLGALRQIALLDRATREGRGWELPVDLQENFGELQGKTVGFVGYGAIPQRLTPILQAMDAKLLYTATSPKPDAVPEWRELETLLKEADIVSLHIPLTPETKEVIGRKALQSMRPGAILVNTARGELVDTTALREALSDGHLSAAGLDVFSVEPAPASDPLFQLDNVVVAPHLAWLTKNTLDRSVAVAVENCRRLESGEALLHQVC